jgi:hypothetical protein
MPVLQMQADGGQLALFNAAHSEYSSHTHSTSASRSSTQATPTTVTPSSSLQPQESAGAPAAAGDPQAADDLQLPAGHLAGEPALLVAPTGGRLLVFDSCLPHEVLPAHKTRLSITAWFYKSKAEPSNPAVPAALAPPCPQPAAAASADAGAARDSSSTNVDTSTAGTCCAAPATEAHDCAAGSLPRGVCVAAATQGNDDSSAAESAARTATGVHRLGIPHVADNLNSGISPAQTAAALPRIFVSIAAFRDEECQWTLRDLFLKAAHPHRVFVGVVWQVDPVADAHFVRVAGGSRTAPFLTQVSTTSSQRALYTAHLSPFRLP